jgi:hypothetical protein
MKSILFVLIASFAISASAHSQLVCPFVDGEFHHISGLQFRVSGGVNEVGHFEALLNGQWEKAYVGFAGRSRHLFLGSIVDDFEAQYEICGEINSDGLSISQIRKLE